MMKKSVIFPKGQRGPSLHPPQLAIPVIRTSSIR